MRHLSMSVASWRPILRNHAAIERTARLLGLSSLIALLASANAPAQSFTDISAGMTNAHHGASIWGDYDGDGDLDALVTGETAALTPTSTIYQNTAGAFASIGASLTGVTGSNGMSRSAWGDFDNDGDLDVVITGSTGFSVSTTLYQNNGGTFSSITVGPSPLIDVGLGSVAWGDYDNDGDLDLFLTGYSLSNPWVATVYRNDGPSGGGWQFTNTMPFVSGNPSPVTRVNFSDGAWGDYDNDGDLDLAVIGYTQNGIGAKTSIYRNDGAGQLVNSGITNVQDVGEGAVAWGDFNNDGYLDLAVSGWFTQAGTAYFNVYTNNQNGTFSLSATLTGIGNSSITVGDYDNDGKLDLVGIGTAAGNNPATLAYKGNGNGTFTLDNNSGLIDLYEGQASFGDYDNDGRLDLIVSGRQVPQPSVFTKVYHNTTGVAANTAPTTPTGLTATSATWNSITVQWNLSTDAQSPQAALHYNISVVDQTAGNTIVMPWMADATTGYRFVPQLGNTNHNTSWTIGGLTSGHTYLIKVQAIDQMYKASAPSSQLTATTSTGTRPDVMIGDCLADVGNEANTACGNYWTSPNIYVRNNPDGTLPGNDVHQTPITGQTNWVYVKVKNIGTALANGKVKVYFSKASTGLSWPINWAGYYVSSVLYGDYIGEATVTNLSGGGGSTIVAIPWNTVPDPNNFNDPDAYHFCLLARYISASDPMWAVETTSTPDNTQNNNNIAWKNISLLNNSHGPIIGPIEVNNAQEIAVATDLELTATDDDGRLLDHATLSFDLGDELFARWQAAGSRGNGIMVVEGEDQRNTVQITSFPARLDGIVLDPGQQLTAHVKVSFPADFDPSLAGLVYNFDMAQYGTFDDGTLHLIGGESYAVEMPDGPIGKPAILNTLGSLLKLEARPNPTSGLSTIAYILPESSRVTLGIYDINGALVRTLVATEQGAGEHAVAWDGTSAGGREVASGTYFYRIQTRGGTAQGQIKIAR